MNESLQYCKICIFNSWRGNVSGSIFLVQQQLKIYREGRQYGR